MLKRIYGIAWKRGIRLNAYPIMYSTYKIKENCLCCKIPVFFWRGNILVIEVYVIYVQYSPTNAFECYIVL